jgi:prepilin-type N-terminal cleavage/methylation domain-containing protein
MRRSGFSVVELLIALLIASVVGAASVRLLLQQRMAFGAQVARSEHGASVRVAHAFFHSELSTLDPSDGDLTVMEAARIVYRGTRSVSFVCVTPDPSGPLTVHAPLISWRPVDPEVDSLLVFAEGDVLTRADDRWVHADVTSVSTSTCDDGMPGRLISATPVHGATLGAVRLGAPVRIGSMHEVRIYRGGEGDWWLGERRFGKAGGWPTIQPVLGPLERGGLEFRYRDAIGQPVSTPQDVALIEIRIQPKPNHPAISSLPPSLMRVALRGR